MLFVEIRISVSMIEQALKYTAGHSHCLLQICNNFFYGI